MNEQLFEESFRRMENPIHDINWDAAGPSRTNVLIRDVDRNAASPSQANVSGFAHIDAKGPCINHVEENLAP